MTHTQKRTKIVATLGPSTETEDVLTDLVQNGLNVARFNFSHGEHAWHKRVMTTVRDVAHKEKASVALLADVQGPHIRTRAEEPVAIQKGDVVRLCDVSSDATYIARCRAEGTTIVIDCPHMISKLAIGHDVFIEDGLMRLVVTDITEEHAICDVRSGGTVKDHKGVNIPDAEIPLPTMTPKDYDDLAFALEQNVDYIAMSFVRSATDITQVRTHIQKVLGRTHDLPKIIAKIERKEALTNLVHIIDAADAVMVARGDLGIEAEPTRVTLLQKEIIHYALAQACPVIVATQMLASMEHNPRPTRAEIADVTNAVIDHADAVMLSAETTVGSYPRETVRTMAEIARNTELSPYDDVEEALPLAMTGPEVEIAESAATFTQTMDARAIVMFSQSGFTARLLSHFRPERMILVATNNQKTYNQLALIWGVVPFLFDGTESREECIEHLITEAKDRGLLHAHDLVVTILGSTKEGMRLELKGSRIV